MSWVTNEAQNLSRLRSKQICLNCHTLEWETLPAAVIHLPRQTVDRAYSATNCSINHNPCTPSTALAFFSFFFYFFCHNGGRSRQCPGTHPSNYRVTITRKLHFCCFLSFSSTPCQFLFQALRLTYAFFASLMSIYFMTTRWPITKLASWSFQWGMLVLVLLLCKVHNAWLNLIMDRGIVRASGKSGCCCCN